MVITRAFQALDEGSIPFTRSIGDEKGFDRSRAEGQL